MTQGSPAYTLSFNLTPMQERISKALIHNYHIGRPTLVLAVCGAGKTEMTFGLIAEAISHGHRVCFCVPRKALCLELYERLTVHFTELSIGLIYGGCQQNIDAPLIICTTHQLYRFVRTPFDVM
ncbi:MAG: DEAD/DEAH box helicase family protein, partial [bacterium]